MKAKIKKLNLEEMVATISPENQHPETDWGDAVGNETVPNFKKEKARYEAIARHTLAKRELKLTPAVKKELAHLVKEVAEGTSASPAFKDSKEAITWLDS